MKASRLIKILSAMPDAEVIVNGREVGSVGRFSAVESFGRYEYGTTATDQDERLVEVIEIREKQIRSI